MEGAHWLHNPQSPVFKRGIHIAQRWFNGSWLMPAKNGCSRALPLRWLLNTLWRGYRAALWGDYQFQRVNPDSLLTRGDLRWIQPALRHAAFAAARS